MGINYRIHAQFTPVHCSDYLCEEKRISTFAGHTDILIIKPEFIRPNKQLSKKVSCAVGGFLGIK